MSNVDVNFHSPVDGNLHILLRPYSGSDIHVTMTKYIMVTIKIKSEEVA